ncbi:hypothetical protein KIPB_008455 [Kipferlia bialata]|uniref:RING-type domain-containing protein n=1 Tax=Kipferlia bialata TaxID=797122 RepID=A0A9K3GLB8_9EUKA|nr:hypothetical protein KIPB_008455 [Kipferlia bialata]|eukprot:g8455.t1
MHLECCICREERDVPFAVTPCSHAFHEPCLRQWLSTRRENYDGAHSECPVCNAECDMERCITILGQSPATTDASNPTATDDPTPTATLSLPLQHYALLRTKFESGSLEEFQTCLHALKKVLEDDDSDVPSHQIYGESGCTFLVQVLQKFRIS